MFEEIKTSDLILKYNLVYNEARLFINYNPNRSKNLFELSAKIAEKIENMKRLSRRRCECRHNWRKDSEDHIEAEIIFEYIPGNSFASSPKRCPKCGYFFWKVVFTIKET